MRSNATVGPPLEVVGYRRDALVLDSYPKLDADDAYLIEVKRSWNEQIVQAFNSMPHFKWRDRRDESDRE